MSEFNHRRCTRTDPNARIGHHFAISTQFLEGQDRMTAVFRAASRVPLPDAVRGVLGEVEGWAGPSGPQDDVSVVALEVDRVEGF